MHHNEGNAICFSANMLSLHLAKGKQPKALRHTMFVACATLLEGQECSEQHTFAATTSLAGRPSSTLDPANSMPNAEFLVAPQASNTLHPCTCSVRCLPPQC